MSAPPRVSPVLPPVPPWSGQTPVSPSTTVMRVGWSAQFLGGHLRDGDPQAGADVDLAGVDRHGAVGVNRQKAVDVAGIERLAGEAARLSATSTGRSAASKAKLTTTAPPAFRRSAT